MYYSKIADTLLEYMSNDVGLDYSLHIDGMYGIAYNTDKSELRLYTVEDDIGLNIGCFVLNEEDIEGILGVDFFKKPLKERFDIVDSVLSSYYYSNEGTYPKPYLKSEMINCIKSDCSNGDYVVVGKTVGVRLNKDRDSVCLYNLRIVDGSINISKKNLEGLEAIYLVLGDDFLSVSDAIKIEIVEDYFNTLN